MPMSALVIGCGWHTMRLVLVNLERVDYPVRLARRRTDALAALETELPDLTVIDPLMTGLLPTLRRDPALRDVPVLASRLF